MSQLIFHRSITNHPYALTGLIACGSAKNVIPSGVEGSKTENIKLKIKMKRFFFIAAIAGAALVSCTKNEVAPSVNEQVAITFDTPVMSAATKAATEIPATFPTDKDFAVYAHHYANGYSTLAAGTRYMTNVQVEYQAHTTNGTWGSDPVYFWPKNGSLTFAAYAPYMTSGVEYANTGFKFTDYTIATEAENQVDLLFSERAYDKTLTDQKDMNNYYYGVQINFLHALSSIQFKVAMEQELADNALDYKIIVEEIKVLNAYSKGDFSQDLEDGPNKTTPAVTTTANKGWSGQEEEENYVAYEGAFTVPTDGTAGATYDAEDNETNLILLPQAMKHETNDVTVQVTYKFRHKEMDEGVYITNNVSSVSLNTSETVKEWLRGKRYIYTLTIGLDEILFAPTVTDWVPETITDLDTL